MHSSTLRCSPVAQLVVQTPWVVVTGQLKATALAGACGCPVQAGRGGIRQSRWRVNILCDCQSQF